MRLIAGQVMFLSVVTDMIIIYLSCIVHSSPPSPSPSATGASGEVLDSHTVRIRNVPSTYSCARSRLV